MPEGNPLVAPVRDDRTAVTGIGIAESAVGLAHGVSNGDWVEAGLGGLGVGLEVLSMVIDPAGTLLSYGVGWLIEHFEPLKQALDWLAGDPPVIRGFADTWGNVAAEVNAVAGEFAAEANAGTAGWTGDAGNAYRGHAAEAADALAGAGTLADGISAGVMIMGEVVAFVREFVRDIVAELVGKLIAWLAELAATLGLATPLVVTQAVTAISKVVKNVADVVRKLVKTIGNVSPRIRKIIDKLDEIFAKLAKLMRRSDGSTTPSAATSASRRADDVPTTHGRPDGTTSPSSTPDTPGSTTPSGTTSPNGTSTTSPSGTRPGSRPDNPRDTSPDVNGRRCANDPIDIASGEMVLRQVDVELAGVLPLVLQRTHVSSYRAGRSFGRSWSSTVDQRIELDDQGAVFVADEGMILVYPPPADGVPVLPEEGPRWPLHRDAEGYLVTKPESGQTLRFAGTAEGPVTPLAAIIDRNGNSVDVQRDADGVPIEVRHSGGYRIGVDSTGGLVTGLRLLGQNGAGDVALIRYRYDEAGRLVEVINSSAQSLRFDYDPAGRITRWEDRNGQWYSYDYDERGRCVRNDGTDGFLAGTFDYADRVTASSDTLGHRTTVFTDSLGNRTTFHLNESHQVAREVDPLGHATVSEWDRYDQLLSRTDPLGRTTRYTYDEDGNLALLLRPDGTQTAATYNALRLPLTITEPDGAVWRREYDERGNLVSETDPAGAATFYGYTARGGLASITDPLGNARHLETNAGGLPTAVTDPLGATTRYVRDVFGRIAQVVDPVGGVTRLGWTVEGKLISRTLPDGATERWRYDGEGNQIEHADAVGQVTSTEYTGFDLPVAHVGPDATRLEFGYDARLRLTTVTNPQGLVWRYDYDAAGNLLSETDFNGRTMGYTYDAAGQLVERTNGAGETTRFSRDALGEVSEKRASGVVTTFGYDAAGRLVHAANPDAEVTVQRDALGRAVAESVNGRTVSSGYDLAGRRLQRTTPSGAESRWEYDANDQPIALATGGHTVRFAYDPAGREVRRSLGAGAMLAQSWDVNHRLAGQTLTAPDRYAPPQHAGQARLVQQRAYQYRPDGQLAGIQDQLAGSRRFVLDPAGRVTAVHGHGWTEQYAYDPAGNITAAAWPLPAGGAPDGEAQGQREYTGTLIRRAGNTHYQHDEQGRTVLRQRRTLSGKTQSWHYTWDADDRLTGVVTPDGVRWRYLYDPLGRRIAKQRLIEHGTGLAEQVDFTWDGLVLAEQTRSRFSADGVLPPEATTTTWNWEPDSFRPVTQAERAPLRNAPQDWVDQQFYALVTDLIGTPTEMVDPDGDLAWRNQTTLWGAALGRITGGPHCPLRFPGQYHDEETGEHYNFHRYYDPTTGRYDAADPLGLGGGPSPHSYVVNPNQWVDPMGLTPCDPGLENRGFRPPPGTRVRPQGIPSHWRVRPSKTGNGVWYHDPKNPGNAVRVMPGNPNSPHVNSQSPYVRWQRNGQPLDVNGNQLPTKFSPDAHIPLGDFHFRPELF